MKGGPTKTALAVIPEEECWELLRSQDVGRIAVRLGDSLHIFPINYLVTDHSIVFRTDSGTMLAAVHTADPVAFEIDQIDAGLASGWSVVVEGRAEEILDTVEIGRLEATALRPWAPGRKAHFVRVTARSVSGRRIVEVVPTVT